MASLTKKYDNQKLFGQVYTPRFVVEKMLLDIGLGKNTILGKNILDPSCGDGRFLTVIAESIIAHSSPEKLKENLEKIQGWDIDSQAVDLCIANLNHLIEGLNLTINWRISVCNSLQKINFLAQKFDVIIGNPPYIRIQHLEETERKFIQNNYQFCKSGSTDTYIAFYELCFSLLNEDGICALITPNTFFYSETAQELRRFFAQNQHILQITNYGDIQLFENATTYSAIMIFSKSKNEKFNYQFAQSQTEFLSRKITFSEIQQQKIWQLSLQESVENNGVKLKDICKIHVGITTLADKIYIFKCLNNAEENSIIEVETKLRGLVKIEKDILKPIIKASKLKNGDDKITEFVLFPYEKVNEKNQIIKEEKLKIAFPLAYRYLLSVKDELDKRDNGKKNTVAWYAFGRSQGLETSFGKKILFSPMNNKPNFILHQNEDATFYSGYCIKYEGDTEVLLSQLNSERMANFIAVSSRDFRGGWKAYNKRVLEDFLITL